MERRSKEKERKKKSKNIKVIKKVLSILYYTMAVLFFIGAFVLVAYTVYCWIFNPSTFNQTNNPH